MNPNPPDSERMGSGPDRSEWTRPLPERLSRPSYWPAMLAFAITLVLLGPVTMFAVSFVGLCLTAIALVGWIGEIFQ